MCQLVAGDHVTFVVDTDEVRVTNECSECNVSWADVYIFSHVDLDATDVIDEDTPLFI